MLEKYDVLSSIGGMLATMQPRKTTHIIAHFVGSWHLEEVLWIPQVQDLDLVNHSDWIRWLGQLFIQDDVRLMKYPGIRYPDWFGVQAQKSRLTRYTTSDQHIILVPGAKMPSQIPICLPTPHFLGSDGVCYIMPLGSLRHHPRIILSNTF